MFKLSDLLQYDCVTIQTHDNPDADAIASAYAVYQYCLSHGVEAHIVYAGADEITKVNLLKMIAILLIPVAYINDTYTANVLVTVDCQYGERNVTKLPAGSIYVIDHHREEMGARYAGVVQPDLGSCATLVWDLLRNEDFDLTLYPNLSTALYYGLYTDTNDFSELYHPLDKDMRDALYYNRDAIKMLKNSVLSISELNIAGQALTMYKNDCDHKYAIFKAQPCDPNILGFISDLALKVDSVNACVVYSVLPYGVKCSVRSCVREVMASEFVAFIMENVGSGGGRADKAGGLMRLSDVEAAGLSPDELIESRVREYFSNCDVIDASSHQLDVAHMRKYRKKKIPLGYAASADIFAEGTPLLIRTLEGDTETTASGGIYVMVGIMGEAYPIHYETFAKCYQATGETITSEYRYSPTVKNKTTGESAGLKQYIKTCVPVGDTFIAARQLTRRCKVFTAWNTEGYMHGMPGDYIAVRMDDANDVYIIQSEIFEKTYVQE